MLSVGLAVDCWRIASFYSQSSPRSDFTAIAADTCHSQSGSVIISIVSLNDLQPGVLSQVYRTHHHSQQLGGCGLFTSQVNRFLVPSQPI